MHTKYSTLTPKLLKIGDEILEWAGTYLCRENEHIKRPKGSQVVCPFVKPAIDNDSFYLAFHPEVNGQSEEQLEQLMFSYIEFFKKMGPFSPGDKMKKTLLMVFNNIPHAESSIMDIVHLNIKDKYVENGLMIGQFHPNCDERGIYNRKLKVSVAPYSFFAIRNMAIHDILFLKEKSEWFMAYNAWFGEKFRKGELDEHTNHLEEYYLMAKKKFNI
jgi:hypothetical protein